jgi:hypothetical protein
MGHRPTYLHRHRGDHRERRRVSRIPIPEPLNPTLIMKEQFIHIDEYGAKRHYSDRKMEIRHREEGPAVEHTEGYKAWFINGKRHREDGPAIEYVDGSKSWYINGKSHREDGPAIEYVDGHKGWFIEGKRHREDGPAIEYTNGSKSWYSNGKSHREDGPAVEYSDGSKRWYLNDKRLTEEEFDARMNPVELTLSEIAAKFGVSVDKLKIKK